MNSQEKLNLVTNYFSEDWAIEKAMQLLEDYEKGVEEQIASREQAPAGAEPWHQAVLDACMVTEACYVASDPVASVNNLIDWHLANERFHIAEQTEKLNGE